MKALWISLRITIAFTLLCGVIYPLIVTGFAKVFYDQKSQGQLIERHGQVVGSLLIAQKFVQPQYFWPRPSAIDYNPLPSGGSNSGPTSKALKDTMATRSANLTTASASGLDPHISPEAAAAQVSRVAQARGLSEKRLQDLVTQYTQGRDLGLLGESTVNVLALNLALDKILGNH